MANSKISALTNNATPASTDIVWTQDSTGANDYKVALNNLSAAPAFITARSELATPQVDADYLLISDDSAGDNKKILIKNLGGYLVFAGYQNLSPVSADGFPYCATLPNTIVPVSWIQWTDVLTTNNGSHYWTIALVCGDDDSGIALFDTSGHTADAKTLTTTTSFSVSPIASTRGMIYLSATKTGSPGNLYITTPSLLYSLG